MSDTAVTAPATTAPVASPSKLFVGNLSFKLKEADLTEKFSAHGSVVSSRIITKRGSSLGYGFVEMDTEAAAQKAIDALNKLEIDGRAINVELTKERSTEPHQVRTTKPRKPRARKPKTNGTTGATETTSPSTSPASTPSAEKPKKRRAPKDATTATTTTTERKPRVEREKKPATPKQPSDNTLYVTNIPFTVGNDQLLEIFKEYSPKAAHIVFNTRLNKSKGFGFVEFNNSADQQKALAVNKKEVEGREITVKIALVGAAEAAAPEAATTTA